MNLEPKFYKPKTNAEIASAVPKAGGTIIFVVGALVGALLGAIVGALALPIFTVFHRLLKRGDQIEEKHFLPLAFGTALAISAFVLGL